MRIETYDIAPEAVLRAIDDGLEAHNFSVAPLHDVLPLVAAARSDNGELIGGAVGRTWGACCESLQLWVRKELRGHGVGRTLLREFEGQGTARGCTVFYLTTLSYQAPSFYAKQGYEVLAKIAGYPNGIVKYLMHRSEA